MFIKKTSKSVGRIVKIPRSWKHVTALLTISWDKLWTQRVGFEKRNKNETKIEVTKWTFFLLKKIIIIAGSFKFMKNERKKLRMSKQLT